MFGMADPWIAIVYLLCILSSLLCVGYGLKNWNSDGETIDQEQAQWAKEEDEISDSL